jgi:hypothetical protein
MKNIVYTEIGYTNLHQVNPPGPTNFAVLEHEQRGNWIAVPGSQERRVIESFPGSPDSYLIVYCDWTEWPTQPGYAQAFTPAEDCTLTQVQICLARFILTNNLFDLYFEMNCSKREQRNLGPE